MAIVDDEPTQAPDNPYIHCEFDGEMSAKISVNMNKVTPLMLWGAARLLEQYANNLWMQGQMQQAQEMMTPPPTILPVHAPLEAIRRRRT